MNMLSLSAHKFYGPKGIGAHILEKGLKLTHSRREHRKKETGGTENVAGIAEWERLELRTANIEKHAEKIRKMRDCLRKGIMEISLQG